MESQPKGLAASNGLLILRVGLGGYRLTHGWGKSGCCFASLVFTGGGTLSLDGVIAMRGRLRQSRRKRET